MGRSIGGLTGDSLVYGLGQVGGRVAQILLVPILTRALAPSEYAVWELVLAYSQTAVLVLVFGMDGALARFFYEEPDRDARVRMVSTSLMFRLTLGTLAWVSLALGARTLTGALLGGEAYTKYFLIGAGALPFTLIWLFCNDVLRVTFQPWKFVVLNLIQVLMIGGLSILFVVVQQRGVIGVFYGRLAADAAAAVIGLILIRHTLRPWFRRDVLKRMLAYGAPLVPGAMAFGIVTAADRFFLQRSRSLDEVAVYAVAMKFFAFVTMGVSGFQMAYGPFAFARAKDPDAPRTYARVLSLFVALSSAGALLVSAVTPEVLAWVAPPEYAGAAVPAAWLAFAAVAQGAYYVTSVGVGLALRTSLLVVSSAIAALLALAGNAWLVPRLGPPGAAMATTAAYIVAAMATYTLAQRVYPLPYRGARALVVFAAALGCAQWLAGPGGGSVWPLRLGVVAAYVAALALSRSWWDAREQSVRPVG
jgi:O-antigen/teichoic acid export membrane protein